jgi:hypothetical protein
MVLEATDLGQAEPVVAERDDGIEPVSRQCHPHLSEEHSAKEDDDRERCANDVGWQTQLRKDLPWPSWRSFMKELSLPI